MGFIAETGMAAFHYDSKNKPGESMEAVAGRVSLVGNVNNPSTLYAQGAAEVAAEVLENLEAGIQMIGPECAIPLQTPIESLLAISETVTAWHAGAITADTGSN
jgi:[methyl-Co(III) methanol-specific corrinoid protein]:coenzyme M methyltransferase